MAAQNLEKANLIGLSDPYVVVHWGSKHIGTTPVIMNTINPTWDFESTFTFRLPDYTTSVLTDSDLADQLKIEMEQENSSLVMTMDVFDK